MLPQKSGWKEITNQRFKFKTSNTKDQLNEELVPGESHQDLQSLAKLKTEKKKIQTMKFEMKRETLYQTLRKFRES